ncbi:MAG: VOC family protein [Caulobacteraceae bacterium]|nr:VOC family protein [Caulobacteraceae bacterium]
MTPAATLPTIDGRLYHFGVVVRDIDAGMARYRTLLGVPAFSRLDTHYEARHRDWRGIIANKNAFGRWGDLVVELVQPGLGNGPAGEFLASRGEGVFHVGYATDDPTQRPGGVTPCFEVHSSRRADGSFGIVYLDTLDALGFFVELVEQEVARRTVERVESLAQP